MTERTYNNAGLCNKCDRPDPSIKWKGQDASPFGGPHTEIGVLLAICQWCGFRWQVKAKDEL